MWITQGICQTNKEFVRVRKEFVRIEPRKPNAGAVFRPLKTL